MFSIQVSELTKKYKKNIVISEVNLTLDSGNLYVISGYNGVGKSTFMKCICELISFQGSIKVDRKISYLPEKVIIPEYIKVIDFLDLVLNIKNKKDDKERLTKYLDKFNISKYRNMYIHTLSLGTRQKILIIQALMDDKDIYLFDEPLNGLDKASITIFKNELISLINQKKLIIIISHDQTIFTDLEHKKLVIEKGEINVI